MAKKTHKTKNTPRRTGGHWPNAQSAEMRLTERRGGEALERWKDGIKKGFRREPDPARILPIHKPGPSLRRRVRLSLDDRIHDSVLALDHHGSAHRGGWVAVWTDANGNTLEQHCWYEGQAVTSAWWLVVSDAEAETIHAPSEDGATTVKEYVMAKTTPKSTKKSTPKTVATEKTTSATAGPRKGTYTVFGRFPATSVIRWMGVEGFSKADATAALEALEKAGELTPCTPNPNTITIQLGAGRRGDAPPAELSEDEQDRLNAFKGRGGKSRVSKDDVAKLAEAGEQVTTQATHPTKKAKSKKKDGTKKKAAAKAS